jgi:predicted glycogen debranching enzyme
MTRRRDERPIRVIPHPVDASGPGAGPRREWLVTNGLGGYASGTVAGVVTRRYHGLLIAALPAPLGRYVMFNHLLERVRLPDRRVTWLGDEDEVAGPNAAERDGHLVEFRLERGLPVWRYEIDGVAIEKRVVMPYGQNTVHIRYALLSAGDPVRLSLRPSVQFRSYEAPVLQRPESRYTMASDGSHHELKGDADLPPLRLTLDGWRAALTLDERGHTRVPYEMERRRGYDWTGSLWSPGYFRVDLGPGAPVTLIASTESWDEILALGPSDVFDLECDRRGRLLAIAGYGNVQSAAAELVLAADQFIVLPAGRIEEAARARAAGEDVRTVIAGYHWFADWGRDAMISLEGLTLCTGRFREAAYILRTFAHYVRDGLIPNMFPDGAREGLYHTADATLWYFHALSRYLRATGDEDLLRSLLPALAEIIRCHLEGTRFGIGVDPQDGLLRQGEAGYQLTWMDAKVDDWVVTPRRGKAVEINALWYNALRLMEAWTQECEWNDVSGMNRIDFRAHADRARRAFNDRFWIPDRGYLYDVVDGERGDDPALRPNQILAVSLEHAVLDAGRWPAVVRIVTERLLTPVGLRTLDRSHPEYKATYTGDLRSRDAAYHQGTVWPWLIGPYVDAWMKVHPGDRESARRLLDGFEGRLGIACVGSLAEIFDAEEPFTPRGCIAQAWSVAEVLRALITVAAPVEAGRGA